MLTCKFSYIDLAGDGGGDQSGAAFFQQLDPALGFGGESVEVRRHLLDAIHNLRLFILGWQWNFDALDVPAIQMRVHSSGLN